MTDNINKPNHYTFGKFECIDVIEELSKQNNLQGIEGFLYGNIYLNRIICKVLRVFCMVISLNICGDINTRMEWKIYKKPDGI